MVATHRPAGVSFAAGWAAIGGAWNLLGAFGAGVLGIGAASTPGVAVVALLLSAFQVLLGFGMLVLAGGLYKVQSWARLGGIVLFGLFSLVEAVSVLAGSIGSLLVLGLNAAALAVLVLDADAFGTSRPDLSEGSASSYRPGR
ncbi:hypothetical protein G9C85_12650 [Halorubellus sp. JP-L1]|uniref:hypothetical protein n=1 Tax=Halorubellus sp. JP-L1 TaxID=2715753 RepID=UPI00140866E7|nr:hypothetical protein [Halorubellus sp. JP-L1]NHN42468.1 hypothetical protein [Halorubellus sp. JP-L1]